MREGDDYAGLFEDYEDMLATEQMLLLEFERSLIRFKTGELVHDEPQGAGDS